jgi:hypothetical protein
MTAHIKLEVLLELADLGVLEGGGTDDVHQAPGGWVGGHDEDHRPMTLHLYNRAVMPSASQA